MGIPCEGKAIFPIVGELNPRIVREAAIQAGLLPKSAHVEPPAVGAGPLPSRPPVLCPGCPHRPTFYALSKLKLPVNGDIGCYTLGLLPPLNAIHTCGCMGAGIGVAHGAAQAGDTERHVAVIGDSTFFHSGIPPLINAVYNQAPIITVIMDNRVTGMTGHQQNPGTGKTILEKDTTVVELEPLVKACGVRHVKTLSALKEKEIETTLKEYARLDEPSVLIVVEPCALLPDQRRKWVPLEVLADKCNGCALCFRIGCPAILKSEELDETYQRPKAVIDPDMCTGCELCAQICPRDAIPFRPVAVESE
jgi:indolepyruvate ferredoxin oxidoreductase alpha subunit